MLKVVLISALTYVALGLGVSKRNQTRGHKNTIIHKDLVDQIKNKTWMWKPFEAEENPLSSKTDEELRGLIGAMIDDDDLEQTGADGNDIPEWTGASYTPFDSRTKWGSCIHPVMNQGSCGSCWAFGATEVLSDRLCIASGGKVDQVLSPQYLVSCDTSKSLGCSGGYPYNAFQYLATNGAPTSECTPYKAKNGVCPKACASSTVPFKRFKCKSGSAIQITGIENMMNQIQTQGPVETTFKVYRDFYSYRSGIYSYASGSYLGGHAVKVIGWGSTNGVNYWIAQNSWGTSWGEKGYFRIKFGNCEFDKKMYACTADPSA